MRAEGRSDAAWVAFGIGLVVALAIGAGLGALVTDDGDDSADAGTAVAAAEPLPVSEVSDNPSAYYMREVWLKGVVADVVGPRSFVLEGRGEKPADDLLVVTEAPRAMVDDSPVTGPLFQNDRLWLRGELRVLDVARLEERLDAELEDDLADREGDPVLVAEEVQMVTNVFPITGETTAARVADRPDEFIGELGLVTGTVSARFGDAAVVLDDTLLVLNASGGESTPAEGEKVSVLGPIRRFDLDQLPANTRDDVDDDLFGEFIERPAVVAYEFRAPKEADEDESAR